MTAANGIRQQINNIEYKEEKMNARKVFCLVCALIVALVLETTALAGPPRLDKKLGEIPIYSGTGYDPAPKVSVGLYKAADSKLPNFYRGWPGTSAAVPNLNPLFHYPLDNNVAPDVRVPQYRPGSSPPTWR